MPRQAAILITLLTAATAVLQPGCLPVLKNDDKAAPLGRPERPAPGWNTPGGSLGFDYDAVRRQAVAASRDRVGRHWFPAPGGIVMLDSNGPAGLVRAFEDDTPSVMYLSFRAHEAPSAGPAFALGFRLVLPDEPPRAVAVFCQGVQVGPGLERPVRRELLERGYALVDLVSVGYRLDNTTDHTLEHNAGEFLKLNAEGVNAALRVFREDETLAPLPVAFVGFSLGSLSMPTAAVRFGPESIDAMVLVGSAAGFVDVVRESPMPQTMDLTKLGLPEFDTSGRTPDDYLRSTPQDPANLGPYLSNVPTLLVFGANDAIVPASQGRLLYESLGEPERWRTVGGHIALFLRLRWLDDNIADWLDRTLGL